MSVRYQQASARSSVHLSKHAVDFIPTKVSMFKCSHLHCVLVVTTSSYKVKCLCPLTARACTFVLAITKEGKVLQWTWKTAITFLFLLNANMGRNTLINIVGWDASEVLFSVNIYKIVKHRG